MILKKTIITLCIIPFMMPTAQAEMMKTASTQRTTHNFNALAKQCSQGVHPNTLQAVARVESQFNPFAIGVVKGRLSRQPKTLAEAVQAAKTLHAQGKNFSMGLMQVNRYNLAAYGLNYETVFDPCRNINAGAKILKDCFDRAGGQNQMALKKAFSCYYSGNFRFGFKSDFKGQPPYVTKVILAAMDNSPHQNIAFSGSLKSAPIQKVSNKQRTGYVPQPTHSETTTSQPQQQNIYIPANNSDDNTTSTVAKMTAAWDVFQEF